MSRYDVADVSTGPQATFWDAGRQVDSIYHATYGGYGDGAHRDDAAFQAVLSGASIRSGTAYLPGHSTYRIEASSSAVSNLTLAGAGQGSVLQAGVVVSQILSIPAATSGLVVRDLKFDGNGLAAACVTLLGGTDVTFERCTFTGATTQLVNQSAAGTRITFRACLFLDPSGAGSIDALVKGGATFINCRFIRTGSLASIQVRLQGNDVAFLGCEWDGNSVATRAIYASHNQSPSRIRIEGCSVKNTGFALSAAAIQVDSGAGVITDWDVLGNVFVNCGAWTSGIGAGAVGFGHSTSGTDSGIVVSDNTFRDCGQAIWVDDGYRGVVIDGNTVDATNQPANTANGGIECHANEFTISGNHLYQPRRAGIYLGVGLGGTQGIYGTVEANVVIDPQQVSGAGTASGIVLSLSDVLCIGNVLVGRGTPLAGSIGIEMNASAGSSGGNVSDVRIADNRIRGFAVGISTAFSGFTITSVGIEGNDLLNNTAPFSANVETDISAGKVIRRNFGYVTENSGIASIANGTTSLVINHGCDFTPSAADVTITGVGVSLNDPGQVYVDTFTSTQMTVHCRNNPGAGGFGFSWSIRRN